MMKKIITILLSIVTLSTIAIAQNPKGHFIEAINNAPVFAIGNANSNPIARLEKGDKFELTSIDGNWYIINYDGKKGYILMKDAREISLETSSKATTTTSVTKTTNVTTTTKITTTNVTVDPELTAKPSGKSAKFPCAYKTIKDETGRKSYKVADIYDVAKVYRENAVKANCFFVISKQEYRLYVYETVNGDTLLAATYPVCYATNTGAKTRTGDRCTPECTINKPFVISGIQDAHTWAHDFKDGRGSFLAYGNWFMRLDLSKSDCVSSVRSNRSIGIHGSTGNAYSVPGNDSEGCIRLRDKDIKDLKTRFAQVGTRVVVKAFDKGKYPFELQAIKKCKGYQQAQQGYRIPTNL